MAKKKKTGVEFKDADPETIELLEDVLRDYFPDLAVLDPPLEIDVRMAVSADPLKAAIKRNGHPCAGRIEKIKPEERSKGGAAVRLKLDSIVWANADEETRKALLHHEISHVELATDSDTGAWKMDAYGRHVVKLRPDDWMLTGFKETVRIFGRKAIERQSLDRVEESLRQTHLPFGDEVVRRVAEIESEEDLPTSVTIESGMFPAISNVAKRLRESAAAS